MTDSDEIVVKSVTVNDILSGNTKVPYSNKQVWLSLQKDCPDLRTVHTYLKNGIRPTNKNTKITSIKRYMRNTKINRHGLLVIPYSEPFLPTRELIVLPQHIIQGLMTSLHIFEIRFMSL